MGSSHKAKVVEAATPETAKKVSTEASRFREDAQKLAAQRFGAMSTDMTKGALNGLYTEAKKKKLGGE